MIFGLNVFGNEDGIFIDSNNFWFVSGDKKFGSEDEYVHWDGENLKIIGDVTAENLTINNNFSLGKILTIEEGGTLEIKDEFNVIRAHIGKFEGHSIAAEDNEADEVFTISGEEEIQLTQSESPKTLIFSPPELGYHGSDFKVAELELSNIPANSTLSFAFEVRTPRLEEGDTERYEWSIKLLDGAQVINEFEYGDSGMSEEFIVINRKIIQFSDTFFTSSEITNPKIEVSVNIRGFESLNDEDRLEFRDVRLFITASKLEINDGTFLAYISPDRYIAQDKENLIGKYSELSTSKLIASDVEFYGDIAIFGDFVASPNPPWTENTTNIVHEGNTTGGATEYARGDHTHIIESETIVSALNKGGLTGGTGISLSGTTSNRLISSGNVTFNLANTAVTSGSYGSNIQVATFTVDNQGRLTSAGNTTIRNASASQSGVVSTGAQTFSGNKTFDGNILPNINDEFSLGSNTNRWKEIYATEITTGGLFEGNLRTEGISQYPTGTVLTWKNGKAVPSDEKGLSLLIGVSKKGKDEPIIAGAEHILVTGDVQVGDFLGSSDKKGHAQKIKYFKSGKIIAQALENANGESNLIKALIQKL